jgi:hypothetical protein
MDDGEVIEHDKEGRTGTELFDKIPQMSTSESKLVPLTKDELRLQKIALSKRMPLGLHKGPIDWNRVISIGEKKLFLEVTPQDNQLLGDVFSWLNGEFRKDEIQGFCNSHKVPLQTLHQEIQKSIDSEKEVVRGPEGDRRIGSLYKIVKWECVDMKTFYYQKGFSGWFENKKTGNWLYCDGPSLPLSHLEMIAYLIRVYVVGFNPEPVIERLPCHKE